MVSKATWFTVSSSKKYKLGLQLNDATSSSDSSGSIQINIYHLHDQLHSKLRHFCFQVIQFQAIWLGAINFGNQATWSAMGPRVT